MNIKGKSLELFFVDGRPDGMLTAEVFNWTGHVLRAPRTQLKEALTRPEARYTGVYLLFGDHEGATTLYVGEAEEMRTRLRDHAISKDWWDTAVLVTSAANNLHKAHVKYLESRLVEIAKDVGKVDLDNGNIPPRSSLSEAAQSNMESFIDTLMMVLPAIRIDAFLNKKRQTSTRITDESADITAPTFECVVPRHGVDAKAILRNGEMIVLESSKVRSSWVGDRASKTSYFKLHDELLANGTIAVVGDEGILTQDYAFSSPSAAAAVVSGRSSNGRTAWKVADTGQTYADWEAANLESPT